MGERLTVQFARGSRARNDFAATDRTAPRPRRTPHRMQISGLPGETSWQVCYSCSFIPDVWIFRIAIWILSGFMFGTMWYISKRPRVYVVAIQACIIALKDTWITLLQCIRPSIQVIELWS
jgi:hypothetical protein